MTTSNSMMNPTNPVSPLSPFSLTNPSQPLSPLNPAVNGTLYGDAPPPAYATKPIPPRDQRPTLGQHDTVGIQVLIAMGAILGVGVLIHFVSLTRDQG